MYRSYFGLNSKPFSIAPDPKFLYLSERHREALAHLVFGLGEGGGFVQLTGEVGTGKTTLCRALLEQIPEHVDVALILNPRLNAYELVATACDELGVSYAHDTQSLKTVIDALNAYLLQAHAQGRRTVLMIDEAQNLAIDVLEQVRLLTNLETTEEKLLQVILIGQPELKQLLARSDLRQLSQRITARYHLDPLNFEETRAYIRHRLRVCGTAENLFTPGAIKLIHTLTGGIPRLINVLCDRALLGAYVEEKKLVDKAIVRKAAQEVVPEQPEMHKQRGWLPWAAVASIIMAVLLGFFFWSALPESEMEAVAMTREPSAIASDPPVAAEAAPVLREEPVPVSESDAAASSAPLELQSLLTAQTPDEVSIMWQQMFKLWGRVYQPETGRLACNQAEQQGLRCLSRSGSWRQLVSLNSPVFLEVAGATGQRSQVLLESIQGDIAGIWVGDRMYEVPVADLQSVWYGQYSLLWYAPVAAESLRPGERGDAILWLREQLAEYLENDNRISVDPYLFDRGLAEAVKAFQADRLLRQDGVVGALTFIHLNSLARDSDQPTLYRRQG